MACGVGAVAIAAAPAKPPHDAALLAGTPSLPTQVNVDNNQVGWYRSTYMGAWCTNDLVATQFTYQENIGSNAVVVLYDPLRTTHGSFSLKVRPRHAPTATPARTTTQPMRVRVSP